MHILSRSISVLLCAFAANSVCLAADSGSTSGIPDSVFRTKDAFSADKKGDPFKSLTSQKSMTKSVDDAFSKKTDPLKAGGDAAKSSSPKASDAFKIDDKLGLSKAGTAAVNGSKTSDPFKPSDALKASTTAKAGDKAADPFKSTDLFKDKASGKGTTGQASDPFKPSDAFKQPKPSTTGKTDDLFKQGSNAFNFGSSSTSSGQPSPSAQAASSTGSH